MSEVRVLGLLPARSGSKGVPGKNLRPFRGRPLLSWAAAALASAKTPARRICSTDDQAIAQVAVSAGLEVPWLRPAVLAGDTSLVVDVIAHALQALQTGGDASYTHVALVQATSPTVTAGDIDAAVNLAVEGEADTVITGFPAGQNHPAIMFSLAQDRSVRWLFEGRQLTARRQDFPPIFVRTGLVYVMRASVVTEKRSIYGDRILALTVPEERSLTIDTERDFRLGEYLVAEMNND